ncbi:MAG: hypothetical protein NTW38_05705 [Candidatus Aminicenantes bacterium]|nr:hypothetical protein [Candidatus Aminicenantes bacterium]
MKTKKKGFIATMAMMAVLGTSVFAAPAASNDNWQVIKNAVREDARPEAVRGEPKWFKVLITDRNSKEENVRITLPLSLIEGLVRLAAADNHHGFRCNGRDLDIDVLEILDQLKKAGPLALVEVNDGDEAIKIWIE